MIEETLTHSIVGSARLGGATVVAPPPPPQGSRFIVLDADGATVGKIRTPNFRIRTPH